MKRRLIRDVGIYLLCFSEFWGRTFEGSPSVSPLSLILLNDLNFKKWIFLLFVYFLLTRERNSGVL